MNLQFYKRGSHNMVTKKVSITMMGGSEKKGKKRKGIREDHTTW
jgi:hypothetical protein